MISVSKYNEIMENIKVTDEMHDRIMNNISNRDEMVNKNGRFKSYKRYASIAAGIILLLIVDILGPNLNDEYPDDNEVTVVPVVAEYETIELLNEAVGFEVQGLNELHSETVKTAYISYGGEMAEIDYESLNNSITYRISKGDEDNSGNYRQYSDIKEVTIDSLEVTLKGEVGLYNLAIWSDGSMS
jgi:hypothetical protein